MQAVEQSIVQIITEQVASLGRSDLFRSPLVAFSSAHDERYAQLKEQIGPWHKNPTELLPSANSVISYFVPFTKAVALDPKSVKDGSALWGEAYQEINTYFSHINQVLADYLTVQGHEAYTIPSTHTYDPAELKSMWSHRSAAAIAGLGAFGANRMLITAKGSGGRFCTLLTSANLTPNKTPAPNPCLYVKNGSCGLCFAVCPVKALAPTSFAPFVCQDELFKNEALLKQQHSNLTSVDTCGKCVSVCPFVYLE